MDSKEKNESLNFVVTTKDGDYYCSYSSIINVSGYGKSKEDSILSFKHNLKVLIQDIQAVASEITPEIASEYLTRMSYLKKWVKSLGTNDYLQNIHFEIEIAEKHLTNSL